jgi:anti-sigma factor RsiW
MTIPDLILEQYRLRELPAAEAQRVERLLSVDEALRRRLEALEQSDEEIAREYPASWLASRVRARLPPSPRLWWAGPVAIAAVAVVALLVAPRRAIAPAPVTSVSPAVEDRIKGLQPALTVYRRTASGSETLANGSVVRAGDLLRVGYLGAGRPYGIIVSIDGLGVVTQHLPPAGDRAAPLVSGRVTLLDQSYELDDAPGIERFYFVTGETPFLVAPVMDAARTVAAHPPAVLPLARELSQSTFSIQKEVKP